MPPPNPPLLSLYDPAERAEGSIDPLGMVGTYERLAERIYPWITVRYGAAEGSQVSSLQAVSAGLPAAHG